MKSAARACTFAVVVFPASACLLLAVLAGCATTSPTGPSHGSQGAFPELVATLNARYYKTPKTCGAQGGPPINCSGIVESVRVGTLDLKDKHYARDAVSFSFLRADVSTRILWVYGISGVIVNHFEGDGSQYPGYSMRPRCLFPTDGATDARPDGCGPVSAEQNPNPPGTSRPCAAQGIRTAKDWAAFHDHKLKEGYRQFGCSFGVTAADFRIAIAGQHLTTTTGSQLGPFRYEWNELVLGAWPRSQADQLPAEAFFFMPKTYTNQYARELQCDYFRKTGRVVPIVRFDLPDIERAPGRDTALAAPPVFSALLSDQAVTTQNPARDICEDVLAASDGIQLYQGMSEADVNRVRDEVRSRYVNGVPGHLSWLFKR